MKLHRNLCTAVITALEKIFVEHQHAADVVANVLRSNAKWGARDRKFVAQTVYDIVRWYRFYHHLSNEQTNNFWSLLGVWCVLHDYELPPWEEFAQTDSEAIRNQMADPSIPRSIKESIPEWLDTLGEQSLGKQWDQELHALNEPAALVLRTNRLMGNRDQLCALFQEQNIAVEKLPNLDDALIIPDRKNLLNHPLYSAGWFEVQDASSQQVAPYLDAEPNQLIVDACAGAGGKTLHLAALTELHGKIIALDIHPEKLSILKERMQRAQATNIEIRDGQPSEQIADLVDHVDRLLLDVPCSGTGTFKRNPDLKWKLTPEFIKEVQELQQNILQQYSPLLKTGGLMVYATCSILPSENEQQIQKFLATHPNFELMVEKHILPSQGFDGFYMAKLKRNQ